MEITPQKGKQADTSVTTPVSVDQKTLDSETPLQKRDPRVRKPVVGKIVSGDAITPTGEKMRASQEMKEKFISKTFPVLKKCFGGESSIEEADEHFLKLANQEGWLDTLNNEVDHISWQ